jgi:hypothetical protein
MEGIACTGDILLRVYIGGSRRAEADIAIAAGPYERLWEIAKSAGTSEPALKGAEATLKGDAALRRSGPR